MKSFSLRRALMMVALVGGVALVAGSAFAAGPPPPGPPVCGSVASLMNHPIYVEGLGAKGDNIVSIPGVSPLHDSPSDPLNNGFMQLCKRCGIDGTGSLIMQFDPALGNIVAHACNAAAAPPWQQGQAVLIRPTADSTCIIPGVECSQPYDVYVNGPGALGDNLFPVPLTIWGPAAPNPQDVCDQLNLQAPSDQVIRFDAGPGNIATHDCGSTPVWNLVLGEGVLIQPTGTRTGGAATIY